MKLSEVAHKVIDLSRKIGQYYDIEFRKRFPTYPVIDGDEDSVPPPPEEKELRDLFSALPEELIYQLALIMNLGRARVGIDGLAANYENRNQTYGSPANAISLMMLYKTVLGDDLSDGLDELRKHGINIDKLPLKKIKVRTR